MDMNMGGGGAGQQAFSAQLNPQRSAHIPHSTLLTRHLIRDLNLDTRKLDTVRAQVLRQAVRMIGVGVGVGVGAGHYPPFSRFPVFLLLGDGGRTNGERNGDRAPANERASESE